MVKGTVTLITGGVRCGKSRLALQLAAAFDRPAFIATAEGMDEEMRRRIENHRREREGRFVTVEEPLDLAGALHRLPEHTGGAILDCLTVWLGNLLYSHGLRERYDEVETFLAAIEHPPCPLVLVGNEVGMGIVPATELGRTFRDLAGELNQQVAKRAGTVILMVCGLPLYLKGEREVKGWDGKIP